ncbi:hypothetical protein B0H16DRAFT_1474976 [Mycena metata]|uniref:Uncharacterized protein n=1 Tax=Mycena metata TaxID=1033252 RepID=A0AAD7HFN8_9AGAR|nr:hypothetical protein B0H16DRAFT_1474976 [Mycena metata]
MARKKKTYKPVSAAMRKSLKAWAKGAQEEVLKPFIPEYSDALDRGWREERDVLETICNKYHALFSWRLKDHEEPPLPLLEYDPFALPTVEDLSDEETVQKRERVEVLNARIQRWLKYRSERLRKTIPMDPRRDPFTVLMGKLTGINAPPKARQAFQQYMHESYETEIAPTVAARFAEERDNIDGNGAASQKGPNAPFRARIAWELFAELSLEEQTALKDRASAEAREAKEAYDKARKSPPSKAPEERQRCIDNIGAFLSPILRGIQEYTGLHSVAIFGGPMPKYGGELKTVHVAYGRSRGANAAYFPSWAKGRFDRDVVGLMHEYLKAAFTMRKGGKRAARAKAKAAKEKGKGKEKEKGKGKKAARKEEEADRRETQSAASMGGGKKRKGKDKEEGKKRKHRGDGEVEENEGDEDKWGDGGKTKKQKTGASVPPPRRSGRKHAATNGTSQDVEMPPVQDVEMPPAPPDSPLTPTRRWLHDHCPDSPVNAAVAAGGSSTAAPAPPLRGSAATARGGAKPLRGGPPCGGGIIGRGGKPTDVGGTAPALSKTAAAALGVGKEAGNRRPNPPPRDSSTPPPSTTRQPACPEEAPEWFRLAYAQVSAEDLGPEFNDILVDWIRLESAYGYRTSSRALPAAKRPSELGAWLQAGRGRRGGPWKLGAEFPNEFNETAAAFGEKWRVWWASLQPTWRGADLENAQWARQKISPYVRPNSSWKGLIMPGANGLFIPLLGVYWWAREARKIGMDMSEELEEAMTDLRWVLDCLAVLKVLEEAEKRQEKGATDQETDQLGTD